VRGVDRAALGHVDVGCVAELRALTEVVQRHREVPGPPAVRELTPHDGHPAPGRQRHAVQVEGVPVGQGPPGCVHGRGVFPGPHQVPRRCAVPVGQGHLRPFGDLAEADQLGADQPG
jgi:hypothetical protein